MQISILGATGLVGRELIPLLARAWPQAQLHLFASRDQTLELEGKSYPVGAATRLEQDDAPRGELAFVALDDAHSARYVPRLRELGYRVVDKSNTYRLNPEVPLVVAGVNDTAFGDADTLVANPNCTTIPLMLAVQPLRQAFGLASLAVASYQAISGAGLATLKTFIANSQAGYAGDLLGQSFAPDGYAGNTVPHNGKTDASGYSSEERKMMLESAKILEMPGVPFSAQCCRVPVAVGHYEQVWIELQKPTDVAAIEAVLCEPHPFLRFVPGAEGAGLSARHCLESRDEVFVGRVRRDLRGSDGHRFCLTVVADNLRLGAATNAVRIASKWYPVADEALRVKTVSSR